MAHVGLVGLGVMGGAFALNLAENGHDVSLLDRDPARAQAVALDGRAMPGRLIACDGAAAFVESLPAPRSVLVLVPAGAPLDAVIAELTPLLDAGDLIADLGNSHYGETEDRVRRCEAAGLMFLGMGVSGGAEGARQGPAIMAGGSRDSWARVAQPLRDVSAKFRGEPCCDWYGPGGAGHFIKMIHNGIEYAVMQMIAEVYGILRDGHGMAARDIGGIFDGWRGGPLASYLIDIAAQVALTDDPDTGTPMLDLIVDSAGQKGTGRWSVIEALHLGAPVGTMAAAVEARNVSAGRARRADMAAAWGAAPAGNAPAVATLEGALTLAKICAYDQGFGVLRAASGSFGWELDLGAIARGWRAGCIIRTGLLDNMAAALAEEPRGLLLADRFADLTQGNAGALQQVVAAAVGAGLQVPALHAALSHVNGGRQERGTANMIQALRDRFGAHRFERFDKPGQKVTGPWHD